MKRGSKSRNRASCGIGRTVAVVSALTHRIDVQFDQVLKQPSERFENPAVKILVVLLVEHFQEVIDPHRNANHLFCVTAEIGGKPVEFQIIGNENVVSDGSQGIYPVKKILVIDDSRREKVGHGDLHEDDNVDTLESRFLKELGQGAP